VAQGRDVAIRYGPSPRDFWIGVGRAFAGALIFAAPILMTMETWDLGSYVDPIRLTILLVVMIPVLVLLNRYSGFRKAGALTDWIADAFVAMLVAAVAAALVLSIFGVINADMPLRELIGTVALQAVPGSFGATLARAQLGGGDPEDNPDAPAPGYGSELFLMMAGALFLSFNIAPTEEVYLIAYKMNEWQKLGLVLASVCLMHAFVYEFEFKGGHEPEPGAGFISIFFRYTVAGYILVSAVNLYILWTLGRLDGVGVSEIVGSVVVLSFPGALGAAVARLIL
jgi:putative integral membrane protein (TIGR02587 family)